MKKNYKIISKMTADSYDIVVGKTSVVDGDISSSGSIRIDGKVNGNITVGGNAIVANEAKIIGSINCRRVEISGEVTGNVTCKEMLIVYKVGVLKGNINVTSFTIEEGAVFDGNCKIDKPKAVKNLTTD